MTAIDPRLADKMSATEGRVSLTGVQALLRVPIDQQRADNRRGLRTATVISGYRGSPLGGVEGVIEQYRDELDAADVRFISGVNEDLAATIVWGSQMAVLEADNTFDGVKGIWYGKGPGVDRSGDAFRHANTSGVGRHGGVLALAGDDPECKSSTIPSATEATLADAGMPVLYPGSVGDILRLGRFGFELSRASGLWVGVKVHTDVADGFATVTADTGDIAVTPYVHEVDGEPWSPTVDNRLIAPISLWLEEEMYGHRLDAARGFVRANPVDRTVGATDAWLGIVAAGKSAGDVHDALGKLGVDDGRLDEVGVRIYVPGMISPLEPQGLRAFARGLDTVLVVEEKRPFLEWQVRDILYGGPDTPDVLGKKDGDLAPLVPLGSSLSSDVLVEPLRRVLERRVDPSRLARRRERIPLVGDGAASELPSRTPYYCSGCPHNRSTVVPEGSLALGGIGCHAMALYMDRDTMGLTHMGAEGAQWVGAAPFVGDQHRFQNLGDGTFSHSGSLAIRQAVAAGTNITYKILYNGVVAMTGGQEAAGDMPVPDLTRWLDAEGVVRTVVVTDDPDKYPKSAGWAPGTRVVDRDRLDEVQRELREIPGVTALIYDQGCAAELRRNRKRGRIETPTTRVMIDERICEGCGHCGEVSNCMSVHPVDTPFGRKTQIHQESCNFDLTCLAGNCPAFVTVELDPDDPPIRRTGAGIDGGEAPPEPAVPDAATIVIVGIGGTGVVTVSQVLSTAAMLDERIATSLDQTGLAQKGGQVISNLRIDSAPHEGAAKVGEGEADTMLIFDIVGGSSPKVLDRAEAGRTAAVVSSSHVPTGDMITKVDRARFPDEARFRTAIDAATDAGRNVWIDAEAIARHVFASQPAANLVVVGIAYQRGLIPVTGDSIERAIELNGVAVETNVEAFRLGRRLATDSDLAAELAEAAAARPPEPPEPTPAVRRLIDRVDPGDSILHEILCWRLPELIEWGDERYAGQYADTIAAVRAVERASGVERADLSRTAARHLFKLMAYKDEYEVARLALESDMAERARRRFGPNATISRQLEPPALKRVGLDRKIAIPEVVARPMFSALHRAKRLRGTRADPFGRTEERRVERELIEEYQQLLITLTNELTPGNYDAAVGIADLADQVRGFDEVKLATVARYRAQVTDALDGWSGGDNS